MSIFTKHRKDNYFDPGKAGLILNPAYLMRRGLAEAIRIETSNVRGRLLDFGCGERPYEKFFQVDEYIGLDIEVSGHPNGCKKPDIYYDGSKIPLPSESVDYVFSAEVFEHVFNAQELFLEIHRVLKPGGTFLLTCPFVWPLHEEPYDFARYTPYALQAKLSKVGFCDIEIRKKGHAVEAILQMSLNYMHEHLLPRNRLINSILSAVYCTCLNLAGRLLSQLLPSSSSLYLSNIVVTKKPAAAESQAVE